MGLRSAPEIVPTNEQWALVSDILGEEDPASWDLPPGAFDRPATVREVCDLMLRAQEYLLTPRRLRDLGERTGRPYLVRAGVVLERYGDRLKQAAKADYEGVVQYALRLLRQSGRTAVAMTKRHGDQTREVRLPNAQESRFLPLRIAGRRSVKAAGRL
jgi:hypothetical protein